jgi:hypothetical protein
MHQTIHVANTDSEFEWASFSSLLLAQSLARYPLCLQLQFLPLLYAQPGDQVAVTALPSDDYLAGLRQTGWWPEGLPHLVSLQAETSFEGARCLSWGFSRQVQAWAKARHMQYEMPKDWHMICLMNSKAFSFRYTCLEEAALLSHEQDLISWLHKVKGPKVLKTCFGLAGQGHRRIDHSSPPPDLLAFCQKEWQQGRPLIGEPWLNRVCDFSTQWLIHPEGQIEEIGATRFETDGRGIYQGTLAGPEELLFASYLPFLYEHRQIALYALKEMVKRGFFGFVGIDALLYQHPQTQVIALYPIVEINGRQTLSLVALRLQQRICPSRLLRLTFNQEVTSTPSLLPLQLASGQGKCMNFHKRLCVIIL